ncbi:MULTISPECIES: hypothetical protein [unclassified Bradyrhizobium]|uniref:phage fiber-tail adaptor protein n=1 Tax=unclassified Bradyrhizobium TaxID=2631580 RepID=UPI0028EE99E8|nr:MULTISPECIES: hypothetical protein [unclassified Bradyrhizobium]
MLVWKDGKGPDEQAPFDIDWSARIGAETIITSDWRITGGDGLLNIMSQNHAGALAQVTLSGGTLGVVYELQNMISTATCPELTEKAQLPIRNR